MKNLHCKIRIVFVAATFMFAMAARTLAQQEVSPDLFESSAQSKRVVAQKTQNATAANKSPSAHVQKSRGYLKNASLKRDKAKSYVQIARE